MSIQYFVDQSGNTVAVNVQDQPQQDLMSTMMPVMMLSAMMKSMMPMFMTQRFGPASERKAKPVIDTVTGREFHSLTECGREMAFLVPGLSPKDPRAYYELIRKFPGRFVQKYSPDELKLVRAGTPVAQPVATTAIAPRVTPRMIRNAQEMFMTLKDVQMLLSSSPELRGLPIREQVDRIIADSEEPKTGGYGAYG